MAITKCDSKTHRLAIQAAYNTARSIRTRHRLIVAGVIKPRDYAEYVRAIDEKYNPHMIPPSQRA